MKTNSQHPFASTSKPINKFLICLLVISLIILGISYFIHWNIRQLFKIERSVKIENPLALVFPLKIGTSSLIIKNDSLIPFKVQSFHLNIYRSDGVKLMEIKETKPHLIPSLSTAQIPIKPSSFQGLSLLSPNMSSVTIEGTIKINILGIRFDYSLNKRHELQKLSKPHIFRQ